MAKKTEKPDELLQKVVEAVATSPKYRAVCAEAIQRLAANELAKQRDLRAAVKGVKNKLHQVGGAYLEGADYARWLEALRKSGDAADIPRLKKALTLIMRFHASTRERLAILEDFYGTTLAPIAPVRSVLDVACGLNPLAIPWMPLAPGAPYTAYDIYTDMIAFLNGFFAYLGVPGRAEARDVTQFVPPEPVHLALVLKTLPCLEQLDKFAGLRLLEGLQAEFVLMTFPVRSLGGYDKNMRANYEAHLHDLLKGRRWTAQRFEFATELAFLIDRREAL